MLHHLRRCLRLSTLLRVVWVVVAALHAWLLIRRLATGNVKDLHDIVVALLCLAGIGYATLKVWHVATFFDSAPRRVFCFSLLLLVGHGFVMAPQHDFLQDAQAITLSTLAVVPALELAVALLLAVALVRRALPVISLCAHRIAPPLVFELHPWTQPNQLAPASLWRRPPPTQN